MNLAHQKRIRDKRDTSKRIERKRYRSFSEDADKFCIQDQDRNGKTICRSRKRIIRKHQSAISYYSRTIRRKYGHADPSRQCGISRPFGAFVSASAHLKIPRKKHRRSPEYGPSKSRRSVRTEERAVFHQSVRREYDA